MMRNPDGTRRIGWQATLRGLASGDAAFLAPSSRLQGRPPLRPSTLGPLNDNYELPPVLLSIETKERPRTSKLQRRMHVAVPPLRLNGNHAHGDMMSLGNQSDVARLGLELEKARQYPEVDTHGGQVIDVTETEEIDDEDGSRVQVLTYTILMADQMTELIKTIRRKFQVQCSQKSYREKTINGKTDIEMSTARMQGDIKGLAPLQVVNQKLRLDENNEQDAAVARVLREAHARMESMFSAEKEHFIAKFPQLFKEKAVVAARPEQTSVVRIQNPDGSYTERSRTSRQFSSQFSRSELYVNGKRQSGKTKVRAFVAYAGPDGGFTMKISNGDEAERSEDEADDGDKSISEDDRKSYASEIGDDESYAIPHHVPSKTDKRLSKAFHAAKELVDSEKRYVDKLTLLEESFRRRVVAEKALEPAMINKLFSNIESLYAFHNSHFYPQLLSVHRDWNATHRLSHIVRRQAPFLKMYSEYTNNYKRACKVFEDANKKGSKFEAIVKNIEKDALCENLPLISHLICPVQRVMRYQLLLQEYLKHLDPTDADYDDTKAALDLVMEAASHANEMMKKLDRYGKVVEAQEQLGNAVSLVSPGRELLRTGVLQKISSSTGKTEERFIFLFNDLIILASERGIPGFAKYKLRAVFDAGHTQVCEGDNLEREYSFYIRGSEGEKSQQRTLELFTETQKEKEDWVAALCKVVDEASHSIPSGSNRISTYSDKGGERNCAECDVEFSMFGNKGYRCSQCSRKLCKKCFGRYVKEAKATRSCEACVRHMGSSRSQPSTSSGVRRDLLAVPASTSSENMLILHASPVKFRGTLGKSLERFFVIRSNFCLYSYTSREDSRALAMLPLPGCEVKMTGEKCTFSLRIGSRRLYMITADSEESQARWMAALDLVANAQLSSPSGSETGSVSSR